MSIVKKGFVTTVHKDRYEVFVEGKSIFARLKSSVYHLGYDAVFPIVGDNVDVEVNESGDSIITNTNPRRTVFSRRDPDIGKGQQDIAANFDYVFIFMSLNMDFNLRRLERYITVSWESGATPVVVLVKSDLAQDKEFLIRQVEEVAIGVDVIAVSVVNGEGLHRLDKYLSPDKTIVFLGSSGVGKSTLTNHLYGIDAMKTGGIREDDSKGHHTTTRRQMIILENGARIIDTPGMRELGVIGVEKGLDSSFADISELIRNCRYSDCTHISEPGCAVIEAIEDGSLDPSRWRSYLKIQKESEYRKRKEAAGFKEKGGRKKDISISIRKMKKNTNEF